MAAQPAIAPITDIRVRILERLFGGDLPTSSRRSIAGPGEESNRHSAAAALEQGISRPPPVGSDR
jgi:hypothetical protein